MLSKRKTGDSSDPRKKSRPSSLYRPDAVESFNDIVVKTLTDDGITVGCGMIYGADFVGYRGNPGTVHSEYAIRVMSNDEAIDWNGLVCFCRVQQQVRKNAVLAFPSTEENNSTPLFMKVTHVDNAPQIPPSTTTDTSFLE